MIKDLLGKTLFSRQINASAGINFTEIPISSYGVMILQIQQGNKHITGKVIICN
jgi:hypothetical protein